MVDTENGSITTEDEPRDELLDEHSLSVTTAPPACARMRMQVAAPDRRWHREDYSARNPTAWDQIIKIKIGDHQNLC